MIRPAENESLLTLFFRPGDHVQVIAGPNGSIGFLTSLAGYHGRVLRESTYKEGYYYVKLVGRVEDLGENPMVCFPWYMLELSDPV